MRAWKLLKDYDRGADHFRKDRPEIEQFERWRAILAHRFVESFSASADTVSEAVKVLSEADPAWATRLDNTIRTILFTFRANLDEISTKDAARYAQLIYNQDYIIDLTLDDLVVTAKKLAARSGVLQQIRVRLYFRRFQKIGDKEFQDGMNEQAEMLKKVINP